MAEAELRQAMAALETTRARMDALARQEELLRSSLQEYQRARNTMAEYAEAPEGTEILVPIGANSFLFASVRDVDRCLVGLGAEVALEDTLEKSLERLDNRIEQLTEVHENLVDQIGQMENQANEQAARVQQMYEQGAAEGGADEGV